MLFRSGTEPLYPRHVYAIETGEFDAARVLRAFRAPGRRGRLIERVPCTAVGTLTLPFGLLAAAGIAHEYRFGLCHAARIAEVLRGLSAAKAEKGSANCRQTGHASQGVPEPDVILRRATGRTPWTVITAAAEMSSKPQA